MSFLLPVKAAKIVAVFSQLCYKINDAATYQNNKTQKAAYASYWAKEIEMEAKATVVTNRIGSERFLTTRTLVQLGMLIAITLIMGLTPLGTIPTPFLSVSLVTVPVAIAAILMGPKGGFIVGGVFGLTSFYNAVAGKSAMMAAFFAINPAATAFTAIVPRLLEGVLCGLIFMGLSKIRNFKTPAYYLAALSCPVLNTILFMSSVVFFFYDCEFIQNLVASKGATNPLHFVILLVGVQGVVEAVTCLVVAGAVSQAVARYLRKN